MKLGKKFTLGFLPTLLCLISMLVVACGGPPAGPVTGAKAPQSQQVMRFAFNGGGPNGDIATFDPAEASDVYSSQSIQLVFTGMVQLDDHLQIKPQLATSWDTSADGMTWTFHLRHNLKFSDGTTLDAHDVAYSINRALSPSVNNLSSGLAATYLGLIKDSAAFTAAKAGAPTTLIGDSIKVIDANTLELDLSQNTGYFLGALAYPTSWVVEKSVIDKWTDPKWQDHLSDNGGQGGDGPFKIQSYSHSTGIKFVPNPNYYGAAPALKEVDYNFFKTADTEYKAYTANQADFSGIPAALIPTEKPKLGAQYHQYSNLSISYLAMNYLAKPFDNIKIRQAFELAINKDVLNTSILKGTDIPTCHIVPAGMPGYNADLKCPGGAPTKGDPTMAMSLLQAGMAEEGITSLPPIKITYSTGPTLGLLMTAIRQMWS
ncbi:MAG: ABC transporter substrate-binding protein, partial [Ktedonobacteraceae bacterium]